MTGTATWRRPAVKNASAWNSYGRRADFSDQASKFFGTRTMVMVAIAIATP